MKRQQPGKQWYGSGRQQGGTHAPNLNDAPPRLNQQHHLHLTVIMRSQGSSPMLRCVQADSMMLQTRECKSIWILDQLEVRTRFLCHFSRGATIAHTPAFPTVGESPAQNEDGIQLASLPPGEKLEKNVDAQRVQPCPTSHTHFLTGGCFHPHERRWINQNSRLLDGEGEGEGRGQNELPARMR